MASIFQFLSEEGILLMFAYALTVSALSVLGLFVWMAGKLLFAEVVGHSLLLGGAIGTAISLTFLSGGLWLSSFIGSLFSAFCSLKVYERLEVNPYFSQGNSAAFVVALFYGLGVIALSLVQLLFPDYPVSVIQSYFLGIPSLILTQEWIALTLFSLLVLSVAFSFRLYLSSCLFDPYYRYSRIKVTPTYARVIVSFFLLLLLFGLVVLVRSLGFIYVMGYMAIGAGLLKLLKCSLMQSLPLVVSFSFMSALLSAYLSWNLESALLGATTLCIQLILLVCLFFVQLIVQRYRRNFSAPSFKQGV